MNFITNLKLSHKLLILLALPLLCLIYFSGINLVREWNDTQDITRMQELTRVSVYLSEFMHESQKERGASGIFVGSQGARFSQEQTEQRKLTDDKLNNLNNFISKFDAKPFGEDFYQQLDKAMVAIGRLKQHRNDIDSLKISSAETVDYFSNTHAEIIQTVFQATKLVKNPQVQSMIQSYYSLMAGKEKAGVERANLSATFAQNHFTSGKLSYIVNNIGAQDSLLETFLSFATPDQRNFYNSKMSDQSVKDVLKMRSIALNKGGAGDFGVDPAVWYKATTNRINLLKDVEDRVAEDLNKLADEEKSKAEHKFLMTLGIIIFGIASAAIAVHLSNVMSDSIVDPLKQCVAFAQKVAKGDLSETLVFNRRDEVGQLSVAFNDMINNLKYLISEIKNNASTVASASEELSTTSSTMQESASEMNSLSNSAAAVTVSLDSNIKTVAAAVEQSSNNMRQVFSASEQVSKNNSVIETAMSGLANNMHSISAGAEEMSTAIATVATAVEEMSASLGEVSKNASQAAKVAGKAEETAKNTTHTVGELGSSAKEIGNVVDVIKGIASQTNLLALNATIEAASAGEAGKGFAVVANEVKELAKQSAEATEDIRLKIEEMQSNTNAAVNAINDIVQVIEELYHINNTIAGAVEEQTSTVNEVSRSISNAAKAASDVSKNVQNSANQIYQVTAQTQEATVGIQEITTHLEELTQGSNEISKSAAGAASGATEMAKSIEKVEKSSTETSQAVSHVKQTAEDLSRLAAKLETLVGSFTV